MKSVVPELSTADYVAAIERHSAGFAAAVRDNLRAQVEHCPDWDVADLVWHLTNVHWFWATIAEERPESPPQDGRPERPAEAELVTTFEQGAERLAAVLRAADQQATCWTWAPGQQNVAFITRHQVQEAAVHHWDAVHAAGGSLQLESAVAADAISEYLTVSVSSAIDPADPPRPALDGTFSLQARDCDRTWVIRDDKIPGTITFAEGSQTESVPQMEASAADLLLWLYGRVNLEHAAVPDALLERFGALTFND